MPGKVKWLWSINGSNVSTDTSNLVTTNTSQTITAPKQFNGAVQFENVLTVHNTTTQDNSLALYRENTKANFVSFFNGTQRQGFFGKANANDTDITVKAETGDLVLDCVDTNHSINASNKNISAVKDPTIPQHAATKNYVDNNKYGDRYTKIYHFNNTPTTNNTDWTQVQNYINMLNSFTMEASTVYEVLFKQNTNGKDIYQSVIIGVNSVEYDNVGITNWIYWDIPGNDAIQYTISLKNNQVKLWGRRIGASSGIWNVSTDIYIRKIGAITIS